MNTTSSDWFSAMALRMNQLDQGVPIPFDWKQSLLTIQLRVVGFAYHRGQFLELQSRARELELKMFEITFPDSETAEALNVDTALAGAQLWAACQALHSACGMMLKVYNQTIGLRSQSNGAASSPGPTRLPSRLAMERLQHSDAYRYLDGFVTLSHGAQLLRVCQRQIEPGNRFEHHLMIDAFMHEFDASVHSFAPKWVDDFLTRDCELLIELCSNLGNALASEIA